MKTGKCIVGMIFCFSGFIFLMIIGALLKAQPKFMHNATKPKSSANSCFEAAALYAFFTICFFGLYKRSKIAVPEDAAANAAIARDRSYYEMNESEEELPLAQHMSPAGRTFTISPSSVTTKSL